MALRDKRSQIIQYIRDNKSYLGMNHHVYDIYMGNLLPYVVSTLRATLSENYFNKIKERIIPINVLERYVDKVSGAYEKPPTRVCKKESDQKVVDYYVKKFGLNQKMQTADKYSHMFKGYALEPYFDKVPKLRVLPYDRFIPYSENSKDPTEETIFIKIVGKKNINGKNSECYYVFTEYEFDAFDEDGNTYQEAFDGNDGQNFYETIPFLYGKRSDNELMPIQDTDILQMAKIPSIFLSDLSGAILFQCFSIIYGIDLDMENAVLSPNALWSFKSDRNADKKPELGTIKPNADIQEVTQFIMSVFVLWLETKGIRVGSVGTVDANSFASGISKIIDEMDVYKVVKESIAAFVNDEEKFWSKMVKIHNVWVEDGLVTGMPKLSEDLEVVITFQEPQPMRSRKDVVEEKKLEVEAGFKSRRKAIKELNPEMTDEELELELAEMDHDGKEEVQTDIQDTEEVMDGQV